MQHKFSNKRCNLDTHKIASKCCCPFNNKRRFILWCEVESLVCERGREGLGLRGPVASAAVAVEKE